MPRSSSPWGPLLAAAVHLYTASGAVLGLLIVLAAVEGNVAQALWLGLIAMVVDGTDGALARRFRVSTVLPWFDGRRLDDIVDYLTYVFAPLVLLWVGGYLPTGRVGLIVAALPLLASCYQFCRIDAKTDDHFFLGFPSYWNIVAFYVIVMRITPAATAALLTVCALLVFVPIRYLYPSRTREFRRLTLALSLLWAVAYAAIVAQLPSPSPALVAASLLYLLYYVGLSIYLTLTGRAAASPAGGSAEPHSG